MLQGQVIGTVTSTIKHPSMNGSKLLVVAAEEEAVLAIDRLGCGVGETVIITSDGKTTAELLGTKATPVRWSVIGIVDPHQ